MTYRSFVPVTREKRLLELFRSAPLAFWRFDVDIDLGSAVHMARFAQVAGIQGTFYLNPRADFYNLFNRQGQHAIASILEAGHRVGLHCDYRKGDVLATLERDFALLEKAGVTTRNVSFHMPPAEVLWVDLPYCNSAYASEWEGRYLADSRGRELLRAPTNDDQVNLHPEWHF